MYVETFVWPCDSRSSRRAAIGTLFRPPTLMPRRRTRYRVIARGCHDTQSRDVSASPWPSRCTVAADRTDVHGSHRERRMSEPNATTSVRDYIERLNREMDACLVRGDLPGYAAFYSDDATIIGFDKRKIQGREAIDRFCFDMTGVVESTAVVLDVGASGDFIYQVATSFARWVRNG